MDNRERYDGLFLEEWLKIQDTSHFPRGINYANRLVGIREYLENEIYPEVEIGALWSAIQNGDTPLYLNDHGIKHVEQVVLRATELLRHCETELSPYEAYILLVAIYFHDVGNIFGRKEHEQRLGDIMLRLGNLAGTDDIEKHAIARIGRAHGGKDAITEDKDTLRKVKESEKILSRKVRSQFLAAVLRFADELADDYTRASRFMLSQGFLEGSEVYHAYSLALHSVFINKHDIDLHFIISKANASKKYNKSTKKGLQRVYLLDEIYERTL